MDARRVALPLPTYRPPARPNQTRPGPDPARPHQLNSLLISSAQRGEAVSGWRQASPTASAAAIKGAQVHPLLPALRPRLSSDLSRL